MSSVCIYQMKRVNCYSGHSYDGSTINIDIGIIRLRRLHAVNNMRPIATDVACIAWSVCMCVCLCVGYTDELRKKWLNRSRCHLRG